MAAHFNISPLTIARFPFISVSANFLKGACHVQTTGHKTTKRYLTAAAGKKATRPKRYQKDKKEAVMN
jgi:hypothetical protein